jgi:competence protein ComEC
MEISKILGRKSFGINNLAFAFLVICILNPESFFKAGFRLSFVATLSILVFNPILLRFQQDPGLITGYLWRNLSLSISCQLGTLPLSIIYFGFVPTYFLLSNLIAIPLSAIVIIVTALLLVLDGTFICPLVSTILNYASSLLVWVVKSIESLPFSVITLR